MIKLVILTLLLVTTNAFSAEKKPEQSTKEIASAVVYPEVGNIRCERLSGFSLADFKTKLVESCDLNKPYSASLSRVLNEDTYFYCCQIRH